MNSPVRYCGFLVFAFYLIILGCKDSNEKIVILNKTPIIVDSQSSHIAFPDSVSLCNANLIAYRVGDTHASDRGYVVIGELNDGVISKKLTIKDASFDIRNPYFISNENKLFLYVTVYDYKNNIDGYVGSRLYKISDNCNLLKQSLLIRNLDWHVVYAPIEFRIASFSKIIKDREWCLSIIEGGKCDIMTNDEELALLDDVFKNTYIGVLRNHPRVGLPLLLLEFGRSGNLISRSEWCLNGNNNSALVSPKIFTHNEKYYVLYAEREIVVKPNLKNIERGAVWIKEFSTVDNLRNCKPDFVYKTPDAPNIDMGYPALSIQDGKMTLIWYETNEISTRLFSAEIRNE